MIALLWFFLTLFASPFKSKSRLEAENAALRHQLICAAAEGARSRPTHKWGSLVLGPAVSMVPIGPRGHHDHPARDSRTLASGRLSPVLALEIPLTWRPTKDRCGPARTDPADERRKSAVGCAAHFLVYPLDFVGHYASARLYAAIIGSAAERRAIR